VLIASLLTACAVENTAVDPSALSTSARSDTSPNEADSTVSLPKGPPPLLYRLDNELYVDGDPLDLAAIGPPRWRPGHPNQVTFGVHSSERSAGVFLFEEVWLADLETGEERVLLDVGDFGWSEAGHFDWDRTGDLLVFAAREDDGKFRPQVLEVATDEVTRIETNVQIIDTVFADDGRMLGVDTSNERSQSETLAWIDFDGTVTAIAPSSGVNRDPAASPDLRHVANIRSTGVLSRVGLGRWDLVVTDLVSGDEWMIGDGNDGFGPPRWINDERLVAKHARYDANGVLSSVPDIVFVSVTTGEISVVEGRARAWDPDPFR